MRINKKTQKNVNHVKSQRRKIMLVFFLEAFLLANGFSYVYGENNLIDNGGMEGAYDGKNSLEGEVAHGWSGWGWVKGHDGIFSEERENPHSGKSSQKIECISPALRFSQDLRDELKADKTYVFSFWGKGNRPIKTDIILVPDGGGGLITQKYFRLTKKWKKYSYVFKPKKSGKAWLSFSLREVGIIWIDDVSLVEQEGVKDTQVQNVLPTKKGNLLKNSSFELKGAGWVPLMYTGNRNISSDNAFDGKYCAELSLDDNKLFSQFVKLKTPLRYTLSAYLRSSSSGTRVVMGIRSGYHNSKEGPAYSISKELILTTTWKRYKLSGLLKSFPKDAYYIFFKVKQAGKESNVWLDAIQLEEGELTKYKPFKNIEVAGKLDKWRYGVSTYFPGEEIKLKTYIYQQKPQEEIKLTYQVVNYYGKETFSKIHILKANGRRHLIDKIRLKIPELGIFGIMIKAEGKQGGKAIGETVCAVIPHPLAIRPEDSFFGNHFLPRPTLLKAAHNFGYKWIRCMNMRNWIGWWKWNEPEKGKFNWSIPIISKLGFRLKFGKGRTEQSYDQILDMYKESGFGILVNVSSSPLWASSAPENVKIKSPAKATLYYPKLDLWKEYIFNLVSRFKDKVKYWEIWNEPYAFTEQTPQQYVELLKVAYKAIKKADPSAKVIGGVARPSGNDYFTREIIKAGALNYMDIFSFHLYVPQRSSDPEYYSEEFQSLKELMQKYGGQKPLWNTETGVWSNQFSKLFVDGVAGDWVKVPYSDYHTAVNDLIRSEVIQLSEGVKRLFYYFFAPRYYYTSNYNIYDMLGFGGVPKPSAVANAIFISLIDNSKYVDRIWFGDKVYIYIFRKAKEKYLIVYFGSYEQDKDAFYTISLPKGKVNVLDVMGNSIGKASYGNNLKLPLPANGEPRYLLVDGITEKEITNVFKNARTEDIHKKGVEKGIKEFVEAKSFNKDDWVFIDLSPYTNMGFRDETAHDGKGGWSDEGKGNDMRGMELMTGRKIFGNVPFQIINPYDNKGTSCIVTRFSRFSDWPIKDFPKDVNIKIGRKLEKLYFLHAVAWAGGQKEIIANYKVNYQDGTTIDIPVKVGTNIADWWYNPQTSSFKISKALPIKVITGYDLELVRYIFAFGWNNPYPEKEINSLDFISEGNAIPILIAVTGVKTPE